MKDQPEALWLADEIAEKLYSSNYEAGFILLDRGLVADTFVELRRLYWEELRVREHRDQMCAEVTRLHEENEALRKANDDLAAAIAKVEVEPVDMAELKQDNRALRALIERLESEHDEMLKALRSASWMLQRDYIDTQKAAVIEQCEAAIAKATGDRA